MNFTLRRALPSLATWLLCALVFGPFLIYPVGKVLLGAIAPEGQFSPALFALPWQDPVVRESILNSCKIGLGAMIAASLLAFPLAYMTARWKFSGKSWLSGLLLVPLLLPPLVGAVGIRQMLGREGVINTILMRLHVLAHPIDWLQLKLPMVIIVAALHLYPLIYLNLTAAWANVDPALEEAAENQGANGWTIFRSVTLPLCCGRVICRAR